MEVYRKTSWVFFCIFLTFLYFLIGKSVLGVMANMNVAGGHDANDDAIGWQWGIIVGIMELRQRECMDKKVIKRE